MAFTKELVIAGQDFPPFNWKEGNTVQGGMTEVMKAVCSELKHTCRFETLNLARALRLLQNGHIDVLLSITENDERSKSAYFSSTISIADVSYLGTAATPKVLTVKDLEGWNVGAVRSSISVELAKKHQGQVALNIQEENDINTLIQKLTHDRYGKKAVIIGAEDALKYFARKSNQTLQTILKVESQDIRIAFSKKKISEAEFATFSKSLEQLKKSGKLDAILNKYSIKPAK